MKKTVDPYEFKRVSTTDYYGRFECAPHIPDLKSGDELCVKWPDGDVTVEKVRFRDGRDSAQIDMSGGPDHFPTRKLVVDAEIRGLKIDLPLKGIKVRKP